MPRRPGLPSFHFGLPEVVYFFSILSSPVARKVNRAGPNTMRICQPLKFVIYSPALTYLFKLNSKAPPPPQTTDGHRV